MSKLVGWQLWSGLDFWTCGRCQQLKEPDATRYAGGDGQQPICASCFKAALVDNAFPIPLLLWCPFGHRHIDRGEFERKPHHTHACQAEGCGIVWRPALVHTVGVEFLPGFKDKEKP